MTQLTSDMDCQAAHTPLSDQLDRLLSIKAALSGGFAAAPEPDVAQTTVKTDTEGLIAGEVMVMAEGQAIPVYRAQPEGKTDLPVILVVSEIFGVHEHIADVARRFAKQGYLALAPSLFVRQGDPAACASISDILREVVANVPDQQVMQDLDACIAWARENGGHPEKLGITGFCWGGRITWLYCAHNPKVLAGVAWYGRLVGNKTELTPSHPVDIACDLKVPVLGLYGAKDTGIPLADVETMRALLTDGSRSEIQVYPGAGHAFYADYRPSYVTDAAQNGWLRCLEWFKSHNII